jgi:uncharacterized membrane protein
VRLDRKLLLIAPTIVLIFVVAGMFYAATQMHVLASVSDSLADRRAFITAVERGQKPLAQRQALNIIDAQFVVEARRSAALTAARDLLVILGAIALVSTGVLAVGIRSVPREHWPRMSFGKSGGT